MRMKIAIPEYPSKYTGTASCPYGPASTIEGFDVLDKKYRISPFPYFKWLNSNSPVYKPFDDQELYVISTYQYVRDALHSPEIFSSEPFEGKKFPLILSLDDPDHKRIRNIVQSAFTPRAMEKLTPLIDQICDDHTTKLLKSGSCDLITTWALPIALKATGVMTGVSVENINDLTRWATSCAKFFFPASGALYEPGSKEASTIEKLKLAPSIIKMLMRIGIKQSFSLINMVRTLSSKPEKRESPTLLLTADRVALAKDIIEFLSYLGRITKNRRSKPQNEVLDMLISAQGKSNVSDAELMLSLAFIIIAGYVTTMCALGSGVKVLCDQPELFRYLKSNPDKINEFIDEILRMFAPANRIMRRCKKEITIGGITIPKNAQVSLMLGAANWDSSIFPDTDTLDLQRTNIQQHLAFGSGPHHCLGRHLAQLEMETAFRLLLERSEAIELDLSIPPEMITDIGAGVFGYLHLGVNIKSK